MAAPRTMAALVLLMIAGSCLADAATVTSTLQHQRKLLTTLPATTTWGSHHTGEKCIVDDVVGKLVKGVLHKIVVYLDVEARIRCIEVVHVDLALLPLSLSVALLPQSCFKRTRSCAELVGVDVKLKAVEFLVNDLKSGTVDGLLKTANKIVAVEGIIGDSGKGSLLSLVIQLSNGVRRSCGNGNAIGLKVKLSVNLVLEKLLGFFSKLCIFNNGISLLELLVVKA